MRRIPEGCSSSWAAISGGDVGTLLVALISSSYSWSRANLLSYLWEVALVLFRGRPQSLCDGGKSLNPAMWSFTERRNCPNQQPEKTRALMIHMSKNMPSELEQLLQLWWQKSIEMQEKNDSRGREIEYQVQSRLRERGVSIGTDQPPRAQSPSGMPHKSYPPKPQCQHHWLCVFKSVGFRKREGVDSAPWSLWVWGEERGVEISGILVTWISVKWAFLLADLRKRGLSTAASLCLSVYCVFFSRIGGRAGGLLRRTAISRCSWGADGRKRLWIFGFHFVSTRSYPRLRRSTWAAAAMVNQQIWKIQAAKLTCSLSYMVHS